MEKLTTHDMLTWMEKYKISTTVIEIFKGKKQNKNCLFFLI
jgi:hypothetical protein